LTFAHEVGHNFGAIHDEEFETCKEKGFIMSGVSTNDGIYVFNFLPIYPFTPFTLTHNK